MKLEAEARAAGMHICPDNEPAVSAPIQLVVRGAGIVVQANTLNFEDVCYGPHLEAGALDVAREAGWEPVLALDPLADKTLDWTTKTGGRIEDVPEWVCLTPTRRPVRREEALDLAQQIATAMGVPVWIDAGVDRWGGIATRQVDPKDAH